MLAIMRAESGCNPQAYNANTNGTDDKGLFQINSIHVRSGLIADEERTDSAKNIEAAYKIWQGSGLRAWVAYINGSYKKYN